MTRREFQFVEGTSNKFWAVSVNDTTVTVQFGKVGTAGQTQLKSFNTVAEATAAAEKLITEKTRKGYKEGTSGVAPAAPPVAPEAGKPTVAVRVVPPSAPPAPERRLNLASEDSLAARGPQPVTPPPLAPVRRFNLTELKRLAQNRYGKLPFDPDVPVTGEEGRFWLHVYTVLGHMDDSYFTALRNLKASQFTTPLSLDALKEAGRNMHYWECNLPTTYLQRWSLPPAEFVELLADNPLARLESSGAVRVAAWLETRFYPSLDAAAMAAVRDRLRSLWQSKDREVALSAMVLSRHAGLETDLAAYVATMKAADVPSDRMNAGFGIALFGIKDAARLLKEAHRLGMRLTSPADARVWMALTGHDGLDVLRDSILAQRKAAALLELLDVLLLAESPEAAVALMEVKLKAKPTEAGTRIKAWMKKHHAHAIAGLTPLTSEKTALGEAARAFLADSAPPGGAPPGTPAPATDAGWLRAALDGVKPSKALPPFADPATMPPLCGLPPADVARVITALSSSTLAGPHPLVAGLRRHGDRAESGAFAWKLFEGWLEAGAPSKEKWALLSLGHFGGDAEVLGLTPLIRAWPGESQHQRAVTGLDVLRTIGSDLALTQLNGMALKLKFKGLQERARQMMGAVATDRGLSRQQLEDRIVPDLGLGADGSRTFDFGPRRFRFALTNDLSAAALDESGKQMKDMPKPGAKDDAAKAGEAVAAWKALKAQLRQALPIQVTRLEEAMVTGRAWTVGEFRSLLVAHPLMTHLVRRLVWQGAALFRVADQGAALGHDGEPVSLEGVESVRIAHRLRLTPAQIDSWRAVLDAQQIEPPFEQLERSVYAPRPAEANGTDFVRPAGDVPALRMRGNLEARGWRRLMHDQGGITGFSKEFPAAGLTAVVVIEPWILIGIPDNDDRHVETAFFMAGVGHPYGPCSGEGYRDWPRVPLANVDAVAFSETVNDLLSLAPSGKG